MLRHCRRIVIFAAASCLQCSLVGDYHFLGGFVLVVEPLARPDAVEAPADPLELFLAKPVSVTRALARVVGRPVTFYREDESALVGRVMDNEVDPVAGNSVLRGES